MPVLDLPLSELKNYSGRNPRPADFDAYWDAGWQIHVHVNGDLGLETVLDIIEDAMARRPRIDHRTVIVHFATSTEEQVERIARLGQMGETVKVRDGFARNFLLPQGKALRANAANKARSRSGDRISSFIPLSWLSMARLPTG